MNISGFSKRINGFSAPYNTFQICIFVSYFTLTFFYFFHQEHMIKLEQKASDTYLRAFSVIHVASYPLIFFVILFYLLSMYINPEYVPDEVKTRKTRRRRGLPKKRRLVLFPSCSLLDSIKRVVCCARASAAVQPETSPSQVLAKPVILKPVPAIPVSVAEDVEMNLCGDLESQVITEHLQMSAKRLRDYYPALSASYSSEGVPLPGTISSVPPLQSEASIMQQRSRAQSSGSTPDVSTKSVSGVDEISVCGLVASWFLSVLRFLCCCLRITPKERGAPQTDFYFIQLCCGAFRILRKSYSGLSPVTPRPDGSRYSTGSNQSNTNNDWVNNSGSSSGHSIPGVSIPVGQPHGRRESGHSLNLFSRPDSFSVRDRAPTGPWLRFHTFASDAFACFSLRIPCLGMRPGGSVGVSAPPTEGGARGGPNISLSMLRLFSLSGSKSQSFTQLPQPGLVPSHPSAATMSSPHSPITPAPHHPTHHQSSTVVVSLRERLKRDGVPFFYQADCMRLTEWGEGFLPSPLRTTQYCFDCNKRVWELDHHCVFLNNCIGRKNYPFFFLLLVCATLNLGLYLATSALFFFYLDEDPGSDSTENNVRHFFSYVYEDKKLFQALNGIYIAVCCLLFSAICFLLCFHLWLNLWRRLGTYDYMVTTRTNKMPLVANSPSNSFSVSSHCLPHYSENFSESSVTSNSQSFAMGGIFGSSSNRMSRGSSMRAPEAGMTPTREIRVKSLASPGPRSEA